MRRAQGPGKVSGLGEKESATGPPPSQPDLRAKLLLGASWALALTGWSYLLLPRMTLSAYFGASGAVRNSAHIRVPLRVVLSRWYHTASRPLRPPGLSLCRVATAIAMS